MFFFSPNDYDDDKSERQASKRLSSSSLIFTNKLFLWKWHQLQIKMYANIVKWSVWLEGRQEGVGVEITESEKQTNKQNGKQGMDKLCSESVNFFYVNCFSFF